MPGGRGARRNYLSFLVQISRDGTRLSAHRNAYQEPDPNTLLKHENSTSYQLSARTRDGSPRCKSCRLAPPDAVTTLAQCSAAVPLNR
jgi:hypothetical protein